MNMKIINDNDKIIVYLFKCKLAIDDYNRLNEEIKNIFIKLIKYYKLDLFGYLNVTIFHNDISGCFIEIEKLSIVGCKKDIIDLKILLYKNVPMYFEFDEYPLINNKMGELKYENKKYYLEIKNTKDIYKYLEYGKIVYYNNS